jgi:endogenous inhibitor of DNA gyrase (YacG/DUF329 family)
MPITVSCHFCKKNFESATRKGVTAKYCSKQCYHESMKGPRPSSYSLKDKTCPQCGKVFHPRSANKKFCSRSCASSWNHNFNQRGQGNTRLVKCKSCGKEFKRKSVNHKYCSHECYTNQNKGDKNPKFNNYITTDGRYLRYTEHHPEYPGKYVHQVVWELNNPDRKCNICGNVVEHIHHKDGNKKNNDPSNLIGLCRYCHTSLHAETIRFWEYRSHM